MRVVERVSIYLDREDPMPAEFKACIAKVFSSLDEKPRRLFLLIDARNRKGAGVSVDFVDGEPVFMVEGRRAVHASLRKRWLAEHVVPLVLHGGIARLVLEPTSGNRVRVRPPSFFERVAAYFAVR